ncbi:MAG: hypothetical protein H0V45_14705 [Actinobacteria bacterium]|nr:hypothetical protein [Actinomycetota bacterium]
MVDERFVPDETALALVEQDVTTPWVSATTMTRTGRAGRSAKSAVKVQTPLDGRFAATVRASTSIQADLVLDGRVVARKTGRLVAFRAQVCGSRTASLRLRSSTGTTRFTVTVARP